MNGSAACTEPVGLRYWELASEFLSVSGQVSPDKKKNQDW